MIGHLQETTRSDTSVVEHEVQLTQQSGVIWAVYENGEEPLKYHSVSVVNVVLYAVPVLS